MPSYPLFLRAAETTWFSRILIIAKVTPFLSNGPANLRAVRIEMETEFHKLLEQQANAWFGRAEMAYQQRSLALSRLALAQMWQYQKRLAELKGLSIPSQPDSPENIFSGDLEEPGDQSQPGLVPRRPLPGSGSEGASLATPALSQTETDF
jgi:hypothetical protein